MRGQSAHLAQFCYFVFFLYFIFELETTVRGVSDWISVPEISPVFCHHHAKFSLLAFPALFLFTVYEICLNPCRRRILILSAILSFLFYSFLIFAPQFVALLFIVSRKLAFLCKHPIVSELMLDTFNFRGYNVKAVGCDR